MFEAFEVTAKRSEANWVSQEVAAALPAPGRRWRAQRPLPFVSSLPSTTHFLAQPARAHTGSMRTTQLSGPITAAAPPPPPLPGRALPRLLAQPPVARLAAHSFLPHPSAAQAVMQKIVSAIARKQCCTSPGTTA